METVKSTHLKNLEKNVSNYYDSKASFYDKILYRHHYCYERIIKLIRHLMPSPGKVLEIGCGIGQNLVALNPQYGLGIDFSGKMIHKAKQLYPQKKYPNIKFKKMNAISCSSLNIEFDYIILPLVMTELVDIYSFTTELRKLCTENTKVIHISYNNRWEPLFKIGGKIGLCQKHPVQNWMTKSDYKTFFELSGFQPVKEGFELLCPIRIPFISNLLNRFGSITPLIKSFSMVYYGVLKPISIPSKTKNNISVSVIVPCKNEEDNIDGLVKRIPKMGLETEIIFIDDKSTDSTAKKIKYYIFQDKNINTIKLVDGPGKGKGAACRAGFAVAKNDIFIILDADMTVMPECLPDFIDALVDGRGDFINGSRLVYPYEGEAMRIFNVIGNKMFAMIFTYLLNQPIKDTLCGTKAIWKKDYMKILEGRKYFGNLDVWGDYDWIYGANRHNLKIIEMPIHYRRRVAGKTKMTNRLFNAWIMFKMCRVVFWKTKVL